MKTTPKFRQSTLVEIRRMKKYGPHSRAVFSTQNIKKGQVIEEVPVIRMPRLEAEGGEKLPTIAWYCFAWHNDKKYCPSGSRAIALGYGSLYNHSSEPNARFDYINKDALRFVSARCIRKGEEITINYNQNNKKAKTFFPRKKTIPQ